MRHGKQDNSTRARARHKRSGAHTLAARTATGAKSGEHHRAIMIGTDEEISMEITLSALSTVLMSVVEKLSPEQLADLRRDISTGGKRLRFVCDVSRTFDIHVVTCEAESLDLRHIMTVVDSRDRSRWATDLLRPTN